MFDGEVIFSETGFMANTYDVESNYLLMGDKILFRKNYAHFCMAECVRIKREGEFLWIQPLPLYVYWQ